MSTKMISDCVASHDALTRELAWYQFWTSAIMKTQELGQDDEADAVSHGKELKHHDITASSFCCHLRSLPKSSCSPHACLTNLGFHFVKSNDSKRQNHFASPHHRHDEASWPIIMAMHVHFMPNFIPTIHACLNLC